MNYAIYRTIDGKHPHIIHRFTQAACNHKAKRAATEKLNEMWLRIIDRPDYYQNAIGSDTEFSYDHPTSTCTSQHIRFYIDKI